MEIKSSRAGIGSYSSYRRREDCLWAFVVLVIVLFLGHFFPADALDIGRGEAELVFAQFNGKDFDIYYSRLAGLKWSEETRLCHAEQDDMLPAIAMGGNGVRWVVWGEGDGITARLFYIFNEGGVWSDPKEIHSDLPFNHAPSVMVDSQNVPWVVWQGDDGEGSDIFSSQWNGRGWDPPVRVNRQDGTPDVFPLIGTDDEGKPWVCWLGYDGQRYRAYSSKWSPGGWEEETLSEKGNLYEVLLDMHKKGQLPQMPDFLNNLHQAAMYTGRHRNVQSLPMRYVMYPGFFEGAAAAEVPNIGPTADASGDLLIKGFGDSITQGYPYITEHGDGRRVGGYEPKLETLLNNASRPSQVFNWGWGGEGTVGGLNRIDSVLETGSSKHILILEGTNDPCWAVPVETTIFNLGQMIDKSRTHNVEPILSTLTPDTSYLCGKKPIESEYNPAIKNLASQKGVILADQYEAFIGNWPNLTYDGLHPNQPPDGDGYPVMAQTWFNVLPKAATVTTGAATSVDFTTAILNGTVNPNGSATNYHFEYGPTTAYGTSTPSASAGSGTGAVTVSASVTGLTNETLYHYRLAATNSGGTVYGSDRTFTTHRPSCEGCYGDVVVLQNVTYESGIDCECVAGTSITIGPGVTVQSNATVTFRAPKVIIRSGFNAQNGSVVNIRVP